MPAIGKQAPHELFIGLADQDLVGIHQEFVNTDVRKKDPFGSDRVENHVRVRQCENVRVKLLQNVHYLKTDIAL